MIAMKSKGVIKMEFEAKQSKDPRDEWLDSQEGNWLSSNKVKELEKTGAVVGAIVTEPQLVLKEYEDKKITKLEMEVEVRKERFTLDMTKRDASDLREIWGNNYKTWIGKLLSFTTIPTTKGRSVLAKAYTQPQLPQAQPEQNSGSAHIKFENQMRLKR